MTTREEVMATAVTADARKPVNLRTVDALRKCLAGSLARRDYRPGGISEFLTLIESAEEQGVLLPGDVEDAEVAAAILLEGLPLVALRGMRARWFQWPIGDVGDSSLAGAEDRKSNLRRMAGGRASSTE